MAGARDSWGVARFLFGRSGFLAEVSRCPPRSYQMIGLSPGFEILTLTESEELRCRQNLAGRLSVVCMCTFQPVDLGWFLRGCHDPGL